MFSGTIDTRFWQELVPRLAQTHGFVWDVVVCLSSLLEHVSFTPLEADSLGVVKNQQHRQALKIYNRTIANVRRLIEADKLDNWVIVLSCVLFASVEFQQQHVTIAQGLIRRSCKMSTSHLKALATAPNSAADQDVHQVVTPYVMRKAITIATLGSVLPLQFVADDEASIALEAILSRSPALDQARLQFYDLVNHCFDVIRIAEFIPTIPEGHHYRTLFSSRRQTLLEEMEKWKSSFTLITDHPPDLETAWIASYLFMYWAVAYLSLVTCVSFRQVLFDEYLDLFGEIVAHAASYLGHTAKSPKLQQLSTFDPGLIPPLYFCTMKCRDPVLRREALRLMRLAPQQKDSWAFIAPERVAAKVISVETEQCESPDSVQTRLPLPPEERRFAFVSVVARQTPGGEQRLALELNRFETAVDGSTKMINEYAWLDDAQGDYS
jgi:hypothetical protein